MPSTRLNETRNGRLVLLMKDIVIADVIQSVISNAQAESDIGTSRLVPGHGRRAVHAGGILAPTPDADLQGSNFADP